MVQTRNILKKIRTGPMWLWQRFVQYWRTGWWQKVLTVFGITAIVCVGAMYGIARWYQLTQASKPTALGVSFIADYAQYLGQDPHETYQAILHDLHPKQVRLVSYWADIEPTPNQYNFSELDYEMNQAQAHGVKVSLAIGLRQPRWPECHPPSWIDTTQPLATWEPRLTTYMTAVVNRYKNNPALETYQLENEYYLNAFGECTNFDRDRLSRELALVRKLDPHHPIIMSRSNNYAGFSLRQPLPDIIGISIYRHVWNQIYFTYPFPSWYYAFLAGGEKLLTGRDSVVHELQAEPWPSHGQSILDTSLAEQNKTFSAATLQSTVDFGEQTGLKHIDLWGAEYWYYRMQTLHDPSVWHTAEQIFFDQLAQT